mmetsp:Transcript_20675/g.64869  ORF Transcript_20675/g.64869 Transcript_20675/m.64869 type:complete len:247 (-) Transcript_20675:975-1715(-)
MSSATRHPCFGWTLRPLMPSTMAWRRRRWRLNFCLVRGSRGHCALRRVPTGMGAVEEGMAAWVVAAVIAAAEPLVAQSRVSVCLLLRCWRWAEGGFSSGNYPSRTAALRQPKSPCSRPAQGQQMPSRPPGGWQRRCFPPAGTRSGAGRGTGCSTRQPRAPHYGAPPPRTRCRAATLCSGQPRPPPGCPPRCRGGWRRRVGAHTRAPGGLMARARRGRRPDRAWRSAAPRFWIWMETAGPSSSCVFL